MSRPGRFWRHYLQFDFLGVARITGFSVGRDAFVGVLGFQTAAAALVEAGSGSPPEARSKVADFRPVWKGTLPKDASKVILGFTVRARLLRISVLRTDGPESLSLGVNK